MESAKKPCPSLKLKYRQKQRKSSSICAIRTKRLHEAIQAAFSNGWMQNSGIAFLCATVALIAAMITSTQVKAAAITFASVGTFALWILAALVIRHEARKSTEHNLESKGQVIEFHDAGNELEELVAGIEQHLLGEGFKVEGHKKVQGNSGESFADSEILISGSLGSSTINWLIECRKRASLGPAPVEWIEQLVGRRERMGFDKVFAVSTSGFSESAKNYALQRNVVLRTVTRITDIKSDFKVTSLPYLAYHFQELGFAGPVDLDTPDTARKWTMDVRRPMFKKPEERDFQHFPVFVSRHPDHLHPIDGKTDLFLFEYKDWLDLLAGSDQFRIHNLRAPVRIHQSVKVARVLMATIYEEGQKTLCTEGQFAVDTPKGEVKTRVRVIENADGSKSTQLFPASLPDGYFLDSVKAEIATNE